jgi:hypothetical protein
MIRGERGPAPWAVHLNPLALQAAASESRRFPPSPRTATGKSDYLYLWDLHPPMIHLCGRPVIHLCGSTRLHHACHSHLSVLMSDAGAPASTVTAHA